MGQEENKQPEGIINSPESVRIRFRLVAFILILIGLALGGRFFHIMVVKGDHYLTAARRIYTQKQYVSGQRGEIFDRNGNLLVANSPRMNIACGPYHLKNDDERRRLAWTLSRHFPEKKPCPLRKKGQTPEPAPGSFIRTDCSPDLPQRTYARQSFGIC